MKMTRERCVRRFIAAVLPGLVMIGCGGYGTVAPRTYEYARALTAVCNLQDAGRLERVAAQIQTAADDQELPAREAGWLLDIIAQARNGDWAAAERAARRILSDQIVSAR